MASEETALAGLELEPLPEGWEPLGAVVLFKCRDDDGSETWAFRTSDCLSDEETLGALIARTDLARAWLAKVYFPSDTA